MIKKILTLIIITTLVAGTAPDASALRPMARAVSDEDVAKAEMRSIVCNFYDNNWKDGQKILSVMDRANITDESTRKKLCLLRDRMNIIKDNIADHWLQIKNSKELLGKLLKDAVSSVSNIQDFLSEIEAKVYKSDLASDEQDKLAFVLYALVGNIEVFYDAIIDIGKRLKIDTGVSQRKNTKNFPEEPLQGLKINTYCIKGIQCNLKEGIHASPSHCLSSEVLQIYRDTGIKIRIRKTDEFACVELIDINKIMDACRSKKGYREIVCEQGLLKTLDMLGIQNEQNWYQSSLRDGELLIGKYAGMYKRELILLAIMPKGENGSSYDIEAASNYPEDIFKAVAEYIRDYSREELLLEVNIQQQTEHKNEFKCLQDKYAQHWKAILAKITSLAQPHTPARPQITKAFSEAA